MRTISQAANKLEGQKMFQVLEFAQQLEREGKEVLHFELGDPDFATPKNVVGAAIKSLKKGETHYVPSSGLLELKQAAAEVTVRSRGFHPEMDQLLVCPGANVMIYYALSCALEPGDEVVVPDPSFVSYFSWYRKVYSRYHCENRIRLLPKAIFLILKFLNMKIVRVPLREENEFRLNPDDVAKAISPKTKMVIMNSPSNPTAAVMNEDEVKRIYGLAEKYDIYLISDEVYARMIYQEANAVHYSPSKYDHCKQRTIIVNGFSKSYAMTGWRLGVVTGPPELISKMTLLLETTTSCVAPFVQRAGIEALRGPQAQIYKMIEEYRKRRDAIVAGLNSLPGVRCLKPQGAFYVFPNITRTGLNSEEFARRMLLEAGVALAPGSFFGKFGEGYVRLCYANSIRNIKRAINSMRTVLERKR